MLSILLLAGTVQASLDQKIAYETRAKDIGRVLADLQAKTQVPLEARGLANCPVIVSVRDMQLRKLMDKLAEVTDSAWQAEQNKQVLVRTNARVRQAAQDEAKLRGARFLQWAKVAKWESQHLWTKEEIAKFQADDRKRIEDHARALVDEGHSTPFRRYPNITTPAKSLLRDLLLSLDPAVIGGVLPGATLALDSAGTTRENQLPLRIDPLMTIYRANRRKQAQNAWKEPFEIGPVTVTSNQALILKQLPADAHLTLNLTRGTDGSVRADLAVKDKSTLLDYATERVGFSPEGATQLQIPRDARLSLDPLSTRLQARFSLNSGTHFLVRVGTEAETATHFEKLHPLPDAELLNLLQHPAEVDPLSTLPTDWVLSTAEALKCDVVAYLPDSINQGIWEAKPKALLTELWPSMATSGVGASIDEGLLTLKPIAFGRADRYRVDRRALQTLLEKFGPSSRPSVADLFDYARKVPASYYLFRPDVIWTRALDPNGQSFSSFTFESYYHGLRLAAELPLPADGETLRIPVVDLAPRAVARYLEQQTVWDYLDSPSMAWTVPQSAMTPDGFADFSRDRRDEQVVVTIKRGPGVLGLTESGISLAMSPLDLGFRRGLNPLNLPGIDATSQFKTLSPFTREELTVSYAANAANAFPLTLVGCRDFGPAGTYDQLPSSIKNTADRIAANAKSIKLKLDRGERPTDPPPPKP